MNHSHRPKRSTLTDVANLASVSPATVSIILNGRRSGNDRISEETRQRVMSAVKELDYAPNQIARNLRRRRTERICLFLSRLGVPYHDLMAQALAEAAEQHGYSMFVLTGSNEKQERLAFEQLRRGLADGVIFTSYRFLTNDDLTSLAQMGMAVVADNNSLSAEGVDFVHTAEGDAAFNAVNYLVEKGHRRIGYIGVLSNEKNKFARYEGYLNALEKNQIPFRMEYVQEDFGGARDHAYLCVQQLLKLPERPTAIYCMGDMIAISAIWAAHDAGLRVPDDLAIIGCGNLPEGNVIHPRLTTMGQPQLDFSHFIDLLFSRLESKVPLEKRIRQIKWDLILRQSA